MGRPRKQIDDVTLLGLRGEGKTLKEISKEMGVSVPTLTRRLALLRHKNGLLTRYRELQGLRLTQLKARLLAAIDPDHLEKASIVDLANAVYVIEKAQMAIQGQSGGKMEGLVGYLQALEDQGSKGNGY